MTMDRDDIPYLPILTWSILRAQVRIKINLTMTSTEENLRIFYGIVSVIQSLQSKFIKVPYRKN